MQPSAEVSASEHDYAVLGWLVVSCENDIPITNSCQRAGVYYVSELDSAGFTTAFWPAGKVTAHVAPG